MCILMDGSQKKIPDNSVLVSDNSVSKVYRCPDGFIYKRSIPFLIENELHALQRMYITGHVPRAIRYDKYTIQIVDFGNSEPVTNFKEFKITCLSLLRALKRVEIRHGDLTPPHIIVKGNWPYVIDWAESRLLEDPRPDKRPEGDAYWLNKTVQEITNGEVILQ